MKQRTKEQNGMKCDNAYQVASARTFALAGSRRLRIVEGLISQQESERIPNLRSLYMVVGTGSRSTAEVPVVLLLVQYLSSCSSACRRGERVWQEAWCRQVGWLDVAAILELGGGCGADLAIPFAGRAA